MSLVWSLDTDTGLPLLHYLSVPQSATDFLVAGRESRKAREGSRHEKQPINFGKIWGKRRDLPGRGWCVSKEDMRPGRDEWDAIETGCSCNKWDKFSSSYSFPSLFRPLMAGCCGCSSWAGEVGQPRVQMNARGRPTSKQDKKLPYLSSGTVATVEYRKSCTVQRGNVWCSRMIPPVQRKGSLLTVQ